jgi:fucose permease
MRYVEDQYRSLLIAMLINFILFGVTLTIIGATLPKIIREFSWSYTVTGIVISAGSIGYFASTFLSGILLQRLGPKLVIVMGLMLQTLGLSFFATRSAVLLNLMLNLLIGLGQGGTEVVINFSILRIERSGKSRLMSFMHAAFSAGAIIGPFAVGKIISSGLSWQMVYRFMALVSFLMAGALSILPFSRLKGEDEESRDKPKLIKLLKHPLLILSFLILFLYVGTELGVSAWIAEYYVKIFDTSASVGAYMVSIFWMGLLIGRLGVSFGYRGHRQENVTFALASICAVSLLFAALMKDPWLAGIGFFLAGLGFSAIYPLIMVLVGKYFKQNQGAAIGFAATGGGIGSFAFPFIMAAISDRFGISRGFFFYIALDFLMAALACVVIWQTRMIEKRKTEG